MVFNSVYIHYQDLKKKIKDLNPIPHFIISDIEHDSIKLVGEYYEKNGLAGKRKKNLILNKLFY